MVSCLSVGTANVLLFAAIAAAQQPRVYSATDTRMVLGLAKAAALQIKDKYQRDQVLDEIGSAEAKAGDLNSAVETANRAYPFVMSTMTAIGDHLYASGDADRAPTLGPRLPDGDASSVFAVIASRQAENGKIEDA